MARRASSRLNPGMVVGAVAGIAVLIIAGKSLIGDKEESSGGVPPLVMDELLESGNQLLGNEYVVQGQIDEKLQWTAGRGQLVSVRVETSTGDQYIGIEIPTEFSQLNIDTKQKYTFRVKFKQGGIAVATGVKRL